MHKCLWVGRPLPSLSPDTYIELSIPSIPDSLFLFLPRLAPQLAVTFCLPHTAIMATITDKNAQESASDTPPSLEKGTADRRPSAGDGYVPANLREEDFRTRNGLNLKSFQRRVYNLALQRAAWTDRKSKQVTGELATPNSTAR